MIQKLQKLKTNIYNTCGLIKKTAFNVKLSEI